ncbi:hypothetical protein RB195_021302 [Necator americanus]|uniref:Secreted protein n=1 Tax=Necator americanus TaxID=51031 RepID=A0ABR1EAA3_NECAM
MFGKIETALSPLSVMIFYVFVASPSMEFSDTRWCEHLQESKNTVRCYRIEREIMCSFLGNRQLYGRGTNSRIQQEIKNCLGKYVQIIFMSSDV